MARQERALRTRSALIEAAAEVFHRDGFEQASLAAISTRAGVSNGALHFHFASKTDLAAAVEAAAAFRLGRITGESGDWAGQDGAAVLQELIDASHVLLRGLDEDVVLRAGFALGSARLRVAGSGVDLRGDWQRWVRVVLERAGGLGALAPGVSADDAAALVVASTVGFEVLGGHDARWLAPDTLARFWVLLLPSLVAAPTCAKLVAAGTGGAPGPA
ncbi:ScbR family autoregulator-binding transcription factor [Streptomyces sp. NBC_00239]|uniref:ScbR family autoregulator-binding transcription factor n=1 Tax=Streptomyces sp. NBC_00239 TaxID=2903640 RepID=UPI002E2B0582|nr:ScbR family autoregulator-binding transcription factor [Streptomyces sp. NBC_00239]